MVRLAVCVRKCWEHAEHLDVVVLIGVEGRSSWMSRKEGRKAGMRAWSDALVDALSYFA